MATAEVPDYTFVWWDIRPSPNLGTVEVRAMDAQSRLESVGGIAALIHALAVACADGVEEIAPPTEGIDESSFRAARDGIDATIWWRGALRPVREVGADALAIARPYARELDGEDALDEVERILREGGGADRMRAAHAAGGMDEMLAQLAARVLPLDPDHVADPQPVVDRPGVRDRHPQAAVAGVVRPARRRTRGSRSRG